MYPDFGKYVDVNTMRAFVSAFPYVYADEKHWFLPSRDTPWDMFMPTINKWNIKRRQIMSIYCLVLDESMSAWRPKTTKFGGLPNYMFEPRKPIELGTMLRNSAECMSGLTMNVDPVMVSEQQGNKEFGGEKSDLPDGGEMSAHTAEVLRQIKASELPRGGWVGGDAWFGSVSTAMSCFKRFNVHSTWIIKNNSNFFPKKVLESILKARHGSRPAGKWVVMQTTIDGVPLIAMAYAWSQKGVSYFLSTCGNTKPSVNLYRSKFEDEFGGVGFKDLLRPEIADFLYEFLPLIDEHNRLHQNLLNFEAKCPNKRLLVSSHVHIVGDVCC